MEVRPHSPPSPLSRSKSLTSMTTRPCSTNQSTGQSTFIRCWEYYGVTSAVLICNRPSVCRATVSEDAIPGSTVLTFEAFDSDLSRENCGFDFAIANGNEGNAFQIESSVRFLEGRGFQTVGTLLLAEGLDFETKPLYNLTVVVSDRGVPQRSSSVAAVITISDVNDNPPVFSRAEYTVSLSEGAVSGTEIIRLTATGGLKSSYLSFLPHFFMIPFLLCTSNTYFYFVVVFCQIQTQLPTLRSSIPSALVMR